jgi:HSP20 family protein
MENRVQADCALLESDYSVERFFAEQDPAGQRIMVRFPHAWRPPTDLYETGDAFVARIEIAGMKDNSMSVSIADRELTVIGVRQNQDPRGAYHRMEIMYGEFHVHVRLPATVDERKVAATYADGFLTVTMPKRRARRVQVVPTAETDSTEE